MSSRYLANPVAIIGAISSIVGAIGGIKERKEAKKARKASDPARLKAAEEKKAAEARRKARALLASQEGVDSAFTTLGQPGGPQGATRSLLGG